MLTTVYCLFKHRAKVAAQGRRLGFTVSYDKLSMSQLSRAAIRVSDGNECKILVPVFWHVPEDRPLTKVQLAKIVSAWEKFHGDAFLSDSDLKKKV